MTGRDVFHIESYVERQARAARRATVTHHLRAAVEAFYQEAQRPKLEGERPVPAWFETTVLALKKEIERREEAL